MTVTGVAGYGRQRDWAVTHIYRVPLIRVRTMEEIVAAVRRYPRVRALGTRHTFNGLPDPGRGVLLDMTALPADIVIDEQRRLVTVGAGTRYGDLARALHQSGWALHNLGSLGHLSVGGAIATGAHGSGDHNGSLATAVRGLEHVDANAQIRTITAGESPFDAYVVALGAAGIVTRVTLAIEPTYAMRQDVYRNLPWSALSNIDAVTGAGYSVSIFTRWGRDLGDAWVKRRVTPCDPLDSVPADLLGTPRDHESRNWIVPGITGNVTPQAVRGPWWCRLPHFRDNATPGNGDEIQSEWFVDRAVAAKALLAIRELAPAIRPHLIVSEIRTIAGDRLWLSGAYQRNTLAIHFTWRHHVEVLASCIPMVESALADFDARPHWGKAHAQLAGDLQRTVPRLADTRRLLDAEDPEGRFSSPLLQRWGIRSAS